MKPVDLLLIQPPIHLDPIDLGSRQVSPNIGLAYIAGAQRARGLDVAVIDAHAERLDLAEITERARIYRPGLVGLSAMTYQVPAAARVAWALKEAMPGVPVVLGGCHASALPEETLDAFPQLDATVVGEGEAAAGDLWAGLANGRGSARPGQYVRGTDPAPSRIAPPLVRDLDALPLPAFDLFPLRSYWPFYSRRWLMELPISASRGCPFQCTFCTKAMGDEPRFRSPGSLVAEIERHRADHGVTQVIFTDENFTLKRSLVEGFCEGILSRRLAGKIRFICQSRVSVAGETIRLMARAGFTHITFGIESGDQGILDKARKSIRLEESLRAVRTAKEAGMVVDGNFILGLPFETEETIRRTIDFACGLPLDYASFFLLVPYPGSRVLEMARRAEGNLRLVSDRWEDLGKQTGGAVELASVDRKRMRDLQLRAYLRFYAHPKRWIPVFKKVSPATVVAFLGMRLLPAGLIGRREEGKDRAGDGRTNATAAGTAPPGRPVLPVTPPPGTRARRGRGSA